MDPRFKFLHSKLRKKSLPKREEVNQKSVSVAEKTGKASKVKTQRGRSPASSRKSTQKQTTTDKESRTKLSHNRTFLDIETNGPVLKESFKSVDDLVYTRRLSGKKKSASSTVLNSEDSNEETSTVPEPVKIESNSNRMRRKSSKKSKSGKGRRSLVQRPGVSSLESRNMRSWEFDDDSVGHQRFPSRPRAAAVDEGMQVADIHEEERVLREARGLKIQNHLRAVNRAVQIGKENIISSEKPAAEDPKFRKEDRLIALAGAAAPIAVHATVINSGLVDLKPGTLPGRKVTDRSSNTSTDISSFTIEGLSRNGSVSQDALGALEAKPSTPGGLLLSKKKNASRRERSRSGNVLPDNDGSFKLEEPSRDSYRVLVKESDDLGRNGFEEGASKEDSRVESTSIVDTSVGDSSANRTDEADLIDSYSRLQSVSRSSREDYEEANTEQVHKLVDQRLEPVSIEGASQQQNNQHLNASNQEEQGRFNDRAISVSSYESIPILTLNNIRQRSRSEHARSAISELTAPRPVSALRKSSEIGSLRSQMTDSPVLAAETLQDDEEEEEELFPISVPFSVGPDELGIAMAASRSESAEGVDLDEQRAFDIVQKVFQNTEEVPSEPAPPASFAIKRSRGSKVNLEPAPPTQAANPSEVFATASEQESVGVLRKAREGGHARNRLNSVVKKQLQQLLEVRQRRAEMYKEIKNTRATRSDTVAVLPKEKLPQDPDQSVGPAQDAPVPPEAGAGNADACTSESSTEVGSHQVAPAVQKPAPPSTPETVTKPRGDRLFKPQPPTSPNPKYRTSVTETTAAKSGKGRASVVAAPDKKSRRGSLNKVFLTRTPRFISKFLSNHKSMKKNQETMAKYERIHQTAMLQAAENLEEYDSFEEDDDNRTVSTQGGVRTSFDASARLSHRLSQRALNRLSRRSFKETPNPVHHLPRGGVVVQTSIGAVQFGQPPETVKDSMELGLSVPTMYVIPRERFNLQTGVSVSEIEFPAFFNYFVLQKCVTFLTYRDTHEDLITIMKEALDGPDVEHLYSKHEYSKFCPQHIKDSGPDHVKEIGYFRQPGGAESSRIDVSKLIKFVFFDDHGKGDLGNGVVVYDNERRSQFTLVDKDNEPVKVLYQEAESCAVPLTYLGSATLSRQLLSRKNDKNFLESVASAGRLAAATAPTPGTGSFVIPTFGMTVLGNSHGFDPKGSTSGFVVWVNGQGIMVDPPPHSSQLLLESGIEPQSITATILTHCHADHDAGTFQKMITEHKITLMTTATVFESFKRKYAAVSGLHKDFIQQLVHFRPMFLEEPNYWNGAAFRFFYSLHSIPCVGFEVTYEGKSIVYSGDTFYDPIKLKEMHEAGVLSSGRFERLMSFPWHADVVLHEAGVPPIHTPVEALAKLPEESKKNICLIHIDGGAATKAAKLGFRIATPGVENTIVLIHQKREQRILNFLQLVSSMEIFRHFEVSKALELMLMCTEVRYSAGTNVAERGSPGGKFIILLKGNASVTFDGDKKIFRPGDYLGEISSTTGTTRSATIVAETDVTTMEMDQYALNYLMMNDPHLKMRLEHVVKARSDGSWQAISQNTRLSLLTTAQKQQLQALLSVRKCERGDILWKRESPVELAILIKSGHFLFEEVHGTLAQVAPPVEGEAEDTANEGDDVVDRSHALLSSGMLLFDLLGVLDARPLTTTLICASETAEVFVLDLDNMMSFLDRTPMVALALLKSPILV